jgi:hypothetical protein
MSLSLIQKTSENLSIMILAYVMVFFKIPKD